MIYTLSGERAIRTFIECKTEDGESDMNILCKYLFTEDDMDKIKDFMFTIKGVGVKVNSFVDINPRPMSIEIVDSIESSDWVLYSKDPGEISKACLWLESKRYTLNGWRTAVARYRELCSNTEKWMALFVINTLDTNGDVKTASLANNVFLKEEIAKYNC